MSYARRRPVGLILAAIALALLTLYGFLNAAAFTFAAVLLKSHDTPPTPGLPTAYLAVVQGVMAFVALAISTFSACTVVGLFRLKQWARISTLIFGGLLAFFSISTGASCLLLALNPSILPQQPDAPTTSPDMRIVFFVLAAVASLGALVGIWWLVYFNLRSTRALFAADPLMPPPPPFASPTPMPRQRGIVEILVMCLAALYSFGAVSILVTAFTRIPLFFGGFVLRGSAARLAALAIFLAEAAIAIGLFRRFRPAWFGALAFNALGLVSVLLLLIPANRATFVNYQQELVQHMSLLPAGMPQPEFLFGPGYITLICIGSFVTTAAVAWLLIRARPLFQNPQGATPQP